MLQRPRLWLQTIRCTTKVSPGKDQKSSMPVGQSNQKTRAIVGKSHKDHEEAFPCVNVEREPGQVETPKRAI